MVACLVWATVTAGPAFATAPTITSIKPSSGNPGTVVTITGTAFAGVTGVTFNGAAAQTYTVNSATKVTATAPPGVTTGPIAVATSGGTAQSATPFTVLGPTLVLTPASGPPTTTTTVTGSGFAAGEAVDLYFDSTEFTLAVTDSLGRITGAPLTVAGFVPPGQHWVTAVGRRAGDAAQTPFTVRTNWAMNGFNARGINANNFENLISPSTIGSADVAWSFSQPDAILGQPIVAQGEVFLVSAGQETLLNAATGSEVASASRALGSFVEGGAFGGGHFIAAVNGPGSAPFSGGLISMLPGGTSSWTAFFPAGEEPVTPPIVMNGVVYVGTSAGNVQAVNATTGAPVYTASVGTPIVGLAGYNNQIYALKQRSLTALTSAGATAATANVLSNNNAQAPPMIFQNRIWVSSAYISPPSSGGDVDGYNFALAPVTHLSDEPSGAGFSALAGAGGTVYESGVSGTAVAAVGVSNNTSCEDVTLIPPGPGPAVVAGGLVFVATSTAIEAFDPRTCASLWRANVENAGSPAVSDGQIFVPGGSDLTVFNLGTAIQPGAARPRISSLRPTVHVRRPTMPASR